MAGRGRSYPISRAIGKERMVTAQVCKKQLKITIKPGSMYIKKHCAQFQRQKQKCGMCYAGQRTRSRSMTSASIVIASGLFFPAFLVPCKQFNLATSPSIVISSCLVFLTYLVPGKQFNFCIHQLFNLDALYTLSIQSIQ